MKSEKGLLNKHGLSIHSGWHKKNDYKNNQDNQILASSNPPVITLADRKLQNIICEWCGDILKGNLKYQSINSLLLHNISCINKPKQQPIVKVKKKAAIFVTILVIMKQACCAGCRRRPSPAEAPQIGKIHPFCKMAVNFEPLRGF